MGLGLGLGLGPMSRAGLKPEHVSGPNTEMSTATIMPIKAHAPAGGAALFLSVSVRMPG